MNERAPVSEESLRSSLLTLRVVWAALLVGELTFGIVVLVLVTRESVATPAADLYGPLALLSVAVLVVLTPLGYFIRNQCYKAAWEGHAVMPAGYFKGNFLLLAMLEAVAMVALVSLLVTGRLLVPGLTAAVAVLVQLINFPTGAPMYSRSPEFVRE